MTGPGPGIDGRAAALRVVVEALDDARDGIASTAAEVAVSWRDALGAGWAARLDLLGRELARQAGVASELLRVVDALTGDPDVPEPGHAATGSAITGYAGDGAPTADRHGAPGTRSTTGVPPGSEQGWSLPGVRLGGTEGTRATERRGVVVPTLPDQPGG